MNYLSHLVATTGIQKPDDGYTPEEDRIIHLLVKNSIEQLYSKFPTARMKFIVAAYYELGYPQETIASMLGISQPTLLDELRLIKRILLGKPYSPRVKKVEVRIEDVFTVLLYLAAPQQTPINSQ